MKTRSGYVIQTRYKPPGIQSWFDYFNVQAMYSRKEDALQTARRVKLAIPDAKVQIIKRTITDEVVVPKVTPAKMEKKK